VGGLVVLRWVIAFTFSAVALLLAEDAWPQTSSSDLFRVRPLLDKVDQLRFFPASVVTEKRCEVDSRRIDTSIKFILNTANIPFIEGYAGEGYPATSPEEQAKKDRAFQMPRLSLQGEVRATGAGCEYRLWTWLHETVRGKFLYSGHSFHESVELWTAARTGVSRPADLASQLSNAIEEMLKEFVNLRAEDVPRASQ
jgi:hypothetical protein